MQLGSSNDNGTLNLTKIYKNITDTIRSGRYTCFSDLLSGSEDFLESLHDSYGEKCGKKNLQACTRNLVKLLRAHITKNYDEVTSTRCADSVYYPIIRALYDGLDLPESRIIEAVIDFGSAPIIDDEEPDESDHFDLVASYNRISKASNNGYKDCATPHMSKTKAFLESIHKELGSSCNGAKQMICVERVLKKLRKHIDVSTENMDSVDCTDKFYEPILQNLEDGFSLPDDDVLKEIRRFKDATINGSTNTNNWNDAPIKLPMEQPGVLVSDAPATMQFPIQDQSYQKSELPIPQSNNVISDYSNANIYAVSSSVDKCFQDLLINYLRAQQMFHADLDRCSGNTKKEDVGTCYKTVYSKISTYVTDVERVICFDLALNHRDTPPMTYSADIGNEIMTMASKQTNPEIPPFYNGMTPYTGIPSQIPNDVPIMVTISETPSANGAAVPTINSSSSPSSPSSTSSPSSSSSQSAVNAIVSAPKANTDTGTASQPIPSAVKIPPPDMKKDADKVQNNKADLKSIYEDITNLTNVADCAKHIVEFVKQNLVNVHTKLQSCQTMTVRKDIVDCYKNIKAELKTYYAKVQKHLEQRNCPDDKFAPILPRIITFVEHASLNALKDFALYPIPKNESVAKGSKK